MYLVHRFQEEFYSLENDLLQYFKDDLSIETNGHQEIQLWNRN